MSAPHPPIWSRPRALWGGTGAPAPAGWKKALDDWVICAIRAGMKSDGASIDRRALDLLPYRPDLFTRIGPAALRHPELLATLRTHPSCALALVTGFYDEAAGALEPSLAGSGESIYHLLHWSARHGRALRQPEAFYRRTLVVDSYWGHRHALRTQNSSLLSEVATWCADERRLYASAAAFFLIDHPREPLSPYRDVLLANPFYAYLSLPRLAARGLAVTAKDIRQPKWACHFALSGLAARPHEFVPGVVPDPGWVIELAAGRGWLDQAEKRKDTLRLIAAGPEGHPLRRPALCFLNEGANPQFCPGEFREISGPQSPIGPGRAAPPSPPERIPASLMSG